MQVWDTKWEDLSALAEHVITEGIKEESLEEKGYVLRSRSTWEEFVREYKKTGNATQYTLESHIRDVARLFSRFLKRIPVA